jgi:hypothetical protein
MFSLTRQEQIAIAGVLLALVFGSIVKHYRQTYRDTHPAALPTPTPSLRAKDLYKR